MSTQTPEKHTFQAEIRQLLDIVIHSLYTDREIFVRELISNAADANEKARFLKVSGENVLEPATELTVEISTDDTAKTITFRDHGVGMNRDELVQNLGTIAHSGSKAFLQRLREGQAAAPDGGDKAETASLIGQFGVGFYSAFMVADTVDVYTRSCRLDSGDAHGWHWHSDGLGGYEIEPAEGLPQGTRIILHLKPDAAEFATAQRIQGVIENYSAFVPFPIQLNGEQVNKVQALWTRPRGEVTAEEYEEFYKFVSGDFDKPLFHLHFTADAPLAIQSILFTPSHNLEKMGMSRYEHGVQLYCRKVLIMSKAENLLPEWMRFVHGVVDSEDLPLNISRETMQDSALIQKLNKVLTGRFIKFLGDKAKNAPEDFEKFWKEFSRFVKEGVINDHANRADLAKLLRFESSLEEPGQLVSLSDYITRMPEGQTEIYYHLAPNRENALANPATEGLLAKKTEVLFLYDGWDEFVMERLLEFDGKKLRSAEKAEVTLDDADKPEGALSDDDARLVANFLKESLGGRVDEVKVSKRLVDSPAMAGYEGAEMSSSMRRMMKELQKQQGAGAEAFGGPGFGDRINLEINPRHPLIIKLNSARAAKPEIAERVASQILDNALIAAGLLEDPADMLKRLNALLGDALG
jgi:TNF receptor-associated protein 1